MINPYKSTFFWNDQLSLKEIYSSQNDINSPSSKSQRYSFQPISLSGFYCRISDSFKIHNIDLLIQDLSLFFKYLKHSPFHLYEDFIRFNLHHLFSSILTKPPNDEILLLCLKISSKILKIRNKLTFNSFTESIFLPLLKLLFHWEKQIVFLTSKTLTRCLNKSPNFISLFFKNFDFLKLQEIPIHKSLLSLFDALLQSKTSNDFESFCFTFLISNWPSLTGNEFCLLTDIIHDKLFHLFLANDTVVLFNSIIEKGFETQDTHVMASLSKLISKIIISKNTISFHKFLVSLLQSDVNVYQAFGCFIIEKISSPGYIIPNDLQTCSIVVSLFNILANGTIGRKIDSLHSICLLLANSSFVLTPPMIELNINSILIYLLLEFDNENVQYLCIYSLYFLFQKSVSIGYHEQLLNELISLNAYNYIQEISFSDLEYLATQASKFLQLYVDPYFYPLEEDLSV
jgi:hypothetical protein